MENLELANLDKDTQIVVGKAQEPQDLQIELLRHKQHIAFEVKNAVTNELNSVIAHCFQLMSQEYLNGFSNLENELKLEFQDIKFRFRQLEVKVETLSGRVENFENLLKDREDAFNDRVRKIHEKNVEFCNNLSFLKEDVDMIRADLVKNKGLVLEFRENHLERSDKNSEELKTMINDVRTALEYLKFDFQNILNTEALKVDEKMKNLKLFFENSLKISQSTSSKQAAPFQNLNYHQEMIDYVNDSISKWFSELNPLRIRLEKLEKNDSLISDFIKNRKN